MTTGIAHEVAGILLLGGDSVGTRDGRDVLLTPDRSVPMPVPSYRKQAVGNEAATGGTRRLYRQVLSGWQPQQTLFRFPADGTITAKYRVATQATTVTETGSLKTLALDLTKGFGERITAGSARFRYGGATYVQRAGSVYRDPSPETGAGTFAGTLNPETGLVTLSNWVGGGANAVTLDALVTEVGGQPVDACVFRTPVSPVKSGTLQIRWSDCAGATYSKTIDGSGELEDGDCLIKVDYPRGVVRMRFGRWRAVSGLTPTDLASTWYSETAIINIAGVPSIWQPHPALADSMVYNAVAQTYLPPDSDLLGIDAARLPPDGRALIFRTGMLVLVHHTAALAPQGLTAGATLDCGRARLYRVTIEDSAGARLPQDAYTVDRMRGLVTLADPLDLTDFTGPYTVRHSIADLRRVRDTDINGTLTLLQPLSYAFPAGPTPAQVSGVLFAGTLQARVSNVFAQATWTSVWSESRIGDAPLAQFNDAVYPIAVTDAGAYPDEMLVQFTSATAFRVIGRNLGVVAVGSITEDCAPLNPLTGQPYFTIPYEGWGLGWATGNCLRFRVYGACYPVDLVRAVQPSEPSATSDQMELLLIGNIDA